MTNEKITMRNVVVRFPNFDGAASGYNPAGNRNFNILLTEDEASELREKGFYVKSKIRDDGMVLETLKINVSYRGYSAPKIIVICRGEQIEYTEDDDLSKIDGLYKTGSVIKTDLRFSPYRNKDRTDNYGYSAYLDSIYITIEDDPLAAEYDAMCSSYTPSDDDVPF